MDKNRKTLDKKFWDWVYIWILESRIGEKKMLMEALERRVELHLQSVSSPFDGRFEEATKMCHELKELVKDFAKTESTDLAEVWQQNPTFFSISD